MKMRFCYIIGLFVLLFKTPVQAQFNFGVDAGYTNSLFDVKNPRDNKMKAKTHHGFQFTAIASYLYKDVLWLESGLSFGQKGTSFDPDLTFGYIDSDYEDYDPFSKIEIKTNSIGIPLWAGAKIDLGKSFSIVPKAGYFVSMEIWGRGITKGVDFDNKAFHSEFDLISNLAEMGSMVNPPDYKDKLKSLDEGLQVGLDLMWNKWALRSAYKWGLTERKFFAYQLKSRMFSMSLAYYFK